MTGETPVAPYAWRAVGALAALLIALLLVLAPRYGWHRDELYFLEAGKHLAWGYVDQPPFTPFVARLAHEVAPGNLVVLRLLPAIATAASVALGAALARELGASTRAQSVAAVAIASGGFLLGGGHLLSTAAFDLTAWMALLWLASRLLRTSDQRLWLPFGAVSGAAMLNKNLVVLLVIALAVGLVVDRRWRLLWSPWALGGALVAIAIAAPNLVWQADHGWPQVEMADALSERLAAENRATLLPLQILLAGPLLISVVISGVRALARGTLAAPFRPLLWAWIAGLVLTFAAGGRPYYALPLTLVMLLAGIATRDTAPRRRRLALLAGLNAVVSVPLALPVLPMSAVDVVAAVNESAAEQVGWPELAEQVAGIVQGLRQSDREPVVLLTATYGEAGALDRFGADLGLPPAHSPHNSYADFRRPQDEDATVVAIRFSRERLAPHFSSCEDAGRVDNGFGVDNEVQGTPILVCRGLRAPWDVTWERLRFLS